MKKVCTMCGEVKPIEEFRKYPKGDKRYPYCNDCQAIEGRRRYLESLAKPTDEQFGELKAIYKLYDLREERGLNTFSRMKKSSVMDLVNKQLNRLA